MKVHSISKANSEKNYIDGCGWCATVMPLLKIFEEFAFECKNLKIPVIIKVRTWKNHSWHVLKFWLSSHKGISKTVQNKSCISWLRLTNTYLLRIWEMGRVMTEKRKSIADSVNALMNCFILDHLLLFYITFISYRQVWLYMRAAAVMAVLQLFLSVESLLLSALWFRILKTLEGLNFPFDSLSSFSPSFWNSEERQVGFSKTWVAFFNSFYK